MKNTRKNIIYLAVSQGANYLLPLLIYPVLIKAVGVSDFGKVSLAIVVMQLSFLVIEFGFGYSATRIVALNEDRHQFLTKYLFDIILARLMLFLLSTIMLLFSFYIDAIYEIKELVLIVIVAGFFNIINPNWFFLGLGMLKVMAVNSILSRGISILAAYLLIDKQSSLIFITIILIFPYVFYSMVSVFFLFKKGYVVCYKPKLCEIIDVMRDGAYFFFSTLATSAYTMLTPIILVTVSGTMALGVFNSANLVKQGVAGLVAPVIQAVYPKVNVAYNKDKLNARKFVYKFLKFISGALLLCSLPFMLYSSFIASMLFGNYSEDIVETLQLMSFLPILIAINSIIGLLILVPEGENKKYFKIIISGGGCCLLFIYPLCHSYGAVGAAMSLIIAELVVLLGMMSYLMKTNRSD